jgi:type I restriction enzyme S subunit
VNDINPIESLAGVRKFKPYPAYKDSGVEWLEEIPTHWNVVPLKRLGELQAGAGFPEEEQGITDEVLPFFKVGDLAQSDDGKHLISAPNTVSPATAKRLRAFVFAERTIVFAKVGAALLLNRRRILTRPSCIDNNMMGFTLRTCEVGWAFYWLAGLDFGELANPEQFPQSMKDKYGKRQLLSRHPKSNPLSPTSLTARRRRSMRW